MIDAASDSMVCDYRKMESLISDLLTFCSNNLASDFE